MHASGGVMDEAATAEPASGADFDGTYKLLGELKSGSRSIVYRAEQQKLGSEVAIKVLRDRLPEDPLQREDWNERVRALAALEHPNLVQIAGFGIAGDAPYIAMELLQGESLAARLTRGPLPPELAEQLIQQLLRALAYLHVRGVVHRNLSPGALFLQEEPDGVRLKLIDYGQIQLPANDNADQTLAHGVPEASAYSSPEQAAGGDDVDARSDVYSAGAIILQMLAGGAVARAAEEHASGRTLLAPQPVAAASPEFHGFISKALASDRSERFGNADQMLRALLELPTPWFEPADLGTDEDEAAAATEVKPAAVPAHAASEEEPVLEGEPVPPESPTPPALPIRRRRLRLPGKKLLAAAAALTALGGAGFAAWQKLGPGAQPAAVSGEHGAQLTAPAGAANPPPTAAEEDAEEEAEEDEEHAASPGDESAEAAHGSEAKAEPVPGQQPGAEPPPTAAAPAHGAAAVAQPGEQAHGPGEKEQAPVQGAAPHDPAAKDEPGAAQPGAQGAQAAAAPAPANPRAAAAATAAQAAQAHGPGEAHGAEPQPSAATRGDQAPGAGEPKPAEASAAHDARADAPPSAAAPSEPTTTEPTAPAPKPVDGSVRHVRPTPYDIRELLLLASDKPRPRGSARDPFQGELPKELKVLREAIAKGEPGSAHQLAVLRRFCRDNPEEPIGHLLLAGLYGNRGWNLDALDQYDIAFQKDPGARGDPAMLALPLRMVQSGVADADAARFIARSYQREALPAIDVMLRDKRLEKAAAARLRKLRASAASAGR